MSHKHPLNLPRYKLPTADGTTQPASLDPLNLWWVGDLTALAPPRAGFRPRYNSQLPLFWTMQSALYYEYPGRVGFGGTIGNAPVWANVKNYGDPQTPIRRPRVWWNYYGDSDLTDPGFTVNKLMKKGHVLYGLDRAFPCWVHGTPAQYTRLLPVYLGICGWFPSKALITGTDTAPSGYGWEDPALTSPWDDPPAGGTLPGTPPPIFSTLNWSTFQPLDNAKWKGGEILAYLGAGYSWPIRFNTAPYAKAGNAVLGNLLAQDIASFKAAASNFDRKQFNLYWGYPYDTSPQVQTTLAAELGNPTYNMGFRRNAGPDPFPAYTAYDTDLESDLENFYGLTLP